MKSSSVKASALKTSALRSQPTIAERVICATCSAPYRDNLTDWACPVCDTPSPGKPRRGQRRFDDPDDRLLAIVGLATIANVVLLGVLAAFVVRL